MAFRPPVNRSMRVLSRSFFKQEHVISAARVFTAQNIARISKELKKSKDRLYEDKKVPNLETIVDVPTAYNSSSVHKCILLKPSIKHDDPGTWSETVHGLVNSGDVDLIPYKLQLTYDNWNMEDILRATLPEEVHHEIPSAFNNAGHVAQLNLRDEYLPYKSLIAEVLLDKNPVIETVINKTSTLDEHEEDNVFRTIEYEVLAGKNNLNVETTEHGSKFRFDYSKVFWNSKLSNEHLRLVSKFEPGEAVCDVMAGVGPFAIPAGKKEVFVWANDFNPESYKCLKDAIALNKVSRFVKPFNTDGHDFIPGATTALRLSTYQAKVLIPLPKSQKTPRMMTTNYAKNSANYRHVPLPKVFSHYIMNLPSTAISFLPEFRGIYRGQESLFTANPETRLPMIHCYCFVSSWDGAAGANNEPRKQLILQQISKQLGHDITLADKDLEIHAVRNVAPTKFQLCVSFRLPSQVAFAHTRNPN